MAIHQVVTGNALQTGAVVYLDAAGSWVENLDGAAIATDPTSLARLEAAAIDGVGRCEVTSVYAFAVRLVGGRPAPLSMREVIRAAHAPTVTL